MSKKIARYLFCECKYMVKLQSTRAAVPIDLGQTKQDKCKFSEYFIFIQIHLYSGFYFFDVLPQTFYMALPVLTHSYIMSKNLAFPERIYICLVDLRGNKSETCHTNETRMRHFLVPNGNDHARRAIESILNQYLFFLLATYLEGTLVAKPQNQGKCLNSTQLWMVQINSAGFTSI